MHIFLDDPEGTVRRLVTTQYRVPADKLLRCEQLETEAVCTGRLSAIPLLGRLPKVDLIILEGGKMSVRPYVRPSTKSFFDFNEIWYIGRG